MWGVGVLREIVVVLMSCWSTQTGEEEERCFQVDTGNFAKGPEEAATISATSKRHQTLESSLSPFFSFVKDRPDRCEVCKGLWGTVGSLGA